MLNKEYKDHEMEALEKYIEKCKQILEINETLIEKSDLLIEEYKRQMENQKELIKLYKCDN